MKRLALFCDGTWNRPDAPEPTNVYRLFEATIPVATDGTVQLMKYIPGVGTGTGKEGLAWLADKALGGAFGKGVTANLRIAYSFIAEHYVPGDQLYLFGFSRGAFTARSLAGMLRSTGLPPRHRAHTVGDAIRHYTDRRSITGPATDFSHRFRLKHSPGYITDQSEADWRAERGAPVGLALKIDYLGVWDTVGALGVPAHYGGSAIFNGGHRFHNTTLSRMVHAARHAVSLDETRRSFPPTLWQYDPGLSKAQLRRFEQQWFAGDHGSIGGGGDIKGLSSFTLRWIAAGARKQGLQFDRAFLRNIKKQYDATAPLHNKTGAPGFANRLLRLNSVDRVAEFKSHKELGPRPFPKADLAHAAHLRHRSIPQYRPSLFEGSQ